MKKDLRMVPCPHCGKGISPAQILGAMAAGKKKNFSAAELARRTARLPRREMPFPADFGLNRKNHGP